MVMRGCLVGGSSRSSHDGRQRTQFDRLWEGITPKGVNRTKALKFRQYILEHVRQMRRPLNRDNAKKYWLGQLQAEIKDRDNF